MSQQPPISIRDNHESRILRAAHSLSPDAFFRAHRSFAITMASVSVLPFTKRWPLTDIELGFLALLYSMIMVLWIVEIKRIRMLQLIRKLDLQRQTVQIAAARTLHTE